MKLLSFWYGVLIAKYVKEEGVVMMVLGGGRTLLLFEEV